MRIVAIGATSAIAEHCCRLWVQREPCDLLLVARDAAKAQRIAADLGVRAPNATIALTTMDFLDTAAIEKLADQAAAGGAIDIVLIAHGMMPDQKDVQGDLALCRRTLEVNAISPALFAEAFARHLERMGRGTLAIVGSVAGDRGRKANYSYGATKGFLERYAQGLDHRLAGRGVKVVLIKPGPTDTPLAAAHKARGRKLAAVEDVARTIVRGIDAGRPVVYAPTLWVAIMLVVRSLPRAVFNRLDI
ncbi:MAG: SDR family NAD(P)-dependent oxidoreductase [Alphaproteobacteria bacterium]|nr:SDR family NAD(P)-dependent oxidoreductase [Alphaproteobacteria bacterium]